MTENPTADAVTELSEAFADPRSRIAYQIVDSDIPGLQHVIAITEQDGLEVQAIDVSSLHPIPRRPAGTRTVSDVDSFLAELNRRPLRDQGTLWGNADRGHITAVYNDHVTVDDEIDRGGWRDDKLDLQLTNDPDWQTWHHISGKYYPQEQFGDIIEELRHTITSPDQADLLETIDSIRASTRGEFDSTIQRATGGQKLTYKKEINARAGAVGRQLEIPQHITMTIRPWEGHPNLYEVHAYFRLNITEGSLKLAVKLFPTREILREAWKDLTTTITDEIAKPVYSQP